MQCYLIKPVLQMAEQLVPLPEKSGVPKNIFQECQFKKARHHCYSRSQLSLRLFLYIRPLCPCWDRSESHSFRIITESRHTVYTHRKDLLYRHFATHTVINHLIRESAAYVRKSSLIMKNVYFSSFFKVQ